MPAFSDVTDFLAEVNGEPLELPLRGQVYRFSGSPPIAEALTLREIQRKMYAQARGDIPAETVVVPSEAEFYDRLLGDQLPLMIQNGVTDAEKDHLALTVLMYYLQGSDAAEKHWTGELARKAREAAQGEATPTGKTTTASPKASQPSRGGTRSTKSGPSSKQTSAASTASN